MAINRTAVIVAIHGEGDQATVAESAVMRENNLRQLSNRALLTEHEAQNVRVNVKPDVALVLREEGHLVEVQLSSWDEVEELKSVAGWDEAKRHWQFGKTLNISIGV